MLPDFKELLKSFNAHDVKYLIVGGYAVSYHAQPRATKDLDLFIKADAENAKAIYAALSSFGAPLQGFSVDDLTDTTKFIRFGREPAAVDVLPAIDGVNFDEAWTRRITGVIDVATNLTAFFISREDLVASKIAAGRLRDLADVEEIRDAAASQPTQERGTTPEPKKTDSER
jgi:hypothetical protein